MKQKEEIYFYLETANGNLVRVPESRAGEFIKMQEAIKRWDPETQEMLRQYKEKIQEYLEESTPVKMGVERIRKIIDEGVSLFEFEYNGKDGNIDHYYEKGEGHSFLLWFDGDEKTVYTLDDVMNDPFFDGKSLSEIANKIKVTCY